MLETNTDWSSMEAEEIRVKLEEQIGEIAAIHYPQTAYIRVALTTWINEGNRLEMFAAYIFVSLQSGSQVIDSNSPESRTVTKTAELSTKMAGLSAKTVGLSTKTAGLSTKTAEVSNKLSGPSTKPSTGSAELSAKTAGLSNKLSRLSTKPSAKTATADSPHLADLENSQDISQIKRKWRDLEKVDFASGDPWSRSAKRHKPNPSYTKYLSILAGWQITKRVKGKMVCVDIGPSLADKMLSIVRAISGKDALKELSSQIQILMEEMEDRIDSVAGTNVVFNEHCYDDTGLLNNTGKIVELGQLNIKIKLDHSLARLKYRHNCIRIKRYYDLEQSREVVAAKKAKGKGKGEQGKGNATEAKNTIVNLLHCPISTFDRWLRLGTKLDLLIEQVGHGVLALIPLEISDFRILDIPENAFELVVKMLLEWYPEVKELSDLVLKYLLQDLVEGGLINSATIGKMLAEANTPALKHAVKVLAGPVLMPNPQDMADGVDTE